MSKLRLQAGDVKLVQVKSSAEIHFKRHMAVTALVGETHFHDGEACKELTFRVVGGRIHPRDYLSYNFHKELTLALQTNSKYAFVKRVSVVYCGAHLGTLHQTVSTDGVLAFKTDKEIKEELTCS